MPRFIQGTLIKSDKSIILFIKNLDKNEEDKIIIQELDENHLFINSHKLSYVQEKIYKMQDSFTYNPNENINN